MRKFYAGEYIRGEVTKYQYWLHLVIIALFVSFVFSLSILKFFPILFGIDLTAHIIMGKLTGESG